MKVPGILLKLKRIVPENSYLVGGFLRDLMLDKENFDIDILVLDDPRKTSLKIGDFFNSPSFPLDEERQIYRVICGKYFIDITKVYKKDIYEDLKKRDYTVNTFSIKFKDINKELDMKNIIDIFNAKKDLKRKIIRLLNQKNIVDDPLRILRAFRISSQTGLKIEKNTLNTILKYRDLIKNVSGERIREEMWKIFENKNSHLYIKELFKNKILETIFPEFKLYYDDPSCYFHREGLWGHSYHSLKSTEEILLNLNKYFPRVVRKLNNYFESYIDGRTKRKIILKLGVLLHDIGKPLTAKRINNRLRFFGHEFKGLKEAKKILNRLRASRKEYNSIRTIILHHMRVCNLFENKKITERAIFRFFRDSKDDAINLLIASLSDRLSYRVVREQKKTIERHLKLTKKFIYRFYMEKEKVNPKPLLNGYDIMKILNLNPSKKVGEIKNKIIELQATGKIKTKKEAVDFLKKCSV